MSKRNVVLLIICGALVALLFYAGPDKVANTVEELVMRALGKKEAARRATLVLNAQFALDGLRLELEEEDKIRTFIGQTRRTNSDQATRVNMGRSDTENSWHLAGIDRAVDLYPIDPATGDPDFNAKLPDSVWLTMHRKAAKWGWTVPFRDLVTGKRKYLKSGSWDGGHLEYREGLTFAAAKAAAGGAVG